MSKKSTTTTPAVENSPTDAPAKRTRKSLPHPNRFTFFLMYNVPGHSFFAVKRDRELVAVFSVSTTVNAEFVPLPTTGIHAFAYNAVAGMLKQRNGPIPTLSLVFDAPLPITDDYETLAHLAFLMVPAGVRFMSAPAHEPTTNGTTMLSGDKIDVEPSK